MKKKATIFVVLTLLCILLTVVLGFAVDKDKPEYTEVKATVVSSDTLTKKIAGQRQTVYQVIVLYDGREYELQNAHNSYSYSEGQTVDVFLSEDKLYANIEGVKTSTPLATAYFVFLFGSFAMIMVSSVYVSKARKG